MRHLLLLILLFAPAYSQVTDKAPRKLSTYALASLPSAATWDGRVVIATGVTSGSCTDAGSSRTLCMAVSSAWVPLGGGGGTGAAPVYTTTTYSATPTFTVSTSNLQGFFITLTGNVASSTLATTLATTGQDIWFNICQDGSGDHTFVWPANVTGGGTISGTASACSRQIFRWNGTDAVAVTPMTCPECSGSVVIPAVAVSGLAACAAGTVGARATVNDSNAASFTAGIGAVVAGGGSAVVPVFCDGTNWRIG